MACRPKGPGSGCHVEPWQLPWPGRFYPIHLGTASVSPGRKHGHQAGSASSTDAQRPFTSSWSTRKSGPNPPKSHRCHGNRSQEKEGGLGGQGMQVDQAIDNILHLRGITVMNLRAQG